MRSKELLAAGAMLGGVLLAAAPASATCSLGGTYSTTFTGFVGSQALSVSALLIAGAGVFSGQISYSKNGVIHRDESIAGSYTVGSNCAGSGSITNGQIGTVDFDFTVTNSGRFFTGVETDPGTTVTVTGKR